MALGGKLVHILKSYVLKSITIIFAILLILLFVWLVQGYQKGAYWNAKRAQSAGDITLATELFDKVVRDDAKGLSFKALLALMEIDELCALEKLIDLIDLPDLNWIVGVDRERMCNVIRQRTAGTMADALTLSPYETQEFRAVEKCLWQAWLSIAKDEYDWKDGKFVPKQRE